MNETDGQVATAVSIPPAPPSVSSRTRRRFDEAFRRLSVETWQASALGAADFCRREGLNPKSFARWRSQILGDTTDDDPAAHHAPPAFVPVTMTTGAGAAASPDSPCSSLDAGIEVGSGGIEIVLHGDRRLRVARNFDQAALRRVVQVLEGIGDPGRETPRC
jgi:transposase-like protein